METRVDKLLLSSHNYLDKIQCDVQKGSSPFKCAISTCKNKYINDIDYQKCPYKFHNFPKNPSLALKWKALCRLPLNTPICNLKVCSDHFSLDDYVRNFKEEFLNPSLKRVLKPDALPSINVDPLDVSNLTYSGEAVEEEVLFNPNSKTGVKFNQQNKALIQELASINKEIKITEIKIAATKKVSEQKKITLNSIRSSLKKIKKESKLNAGRNLLSFLSKAQIDLLKGKKKVFWSDDDLANAFSLRHMGGKDFYLYMKNTLNYPLPALSCVQAWAGN